MVPLCASYVTVRVSSEAVGNEKSARIHSGIKPAMRSSSAATGTLRGSVDGIDDVVVVVVVADVVVDEVADEGMVVDVSEADELVVVSEVIEDIVQPVRKTNVIISRTKKGRFIQSLLQ
jgi:hypothetical protein